MSANRKAVSTFLDIETASSIQKIAGRINESIYAEAKILLMINPQMKDAALGNLKLHQQGES